MPVPGYEIHGYAIVSDDDMIADGNGDMPDALRNQADWDYFQGELDRARLVVLGRRSHLQSPNAKRRPRLVLSRRVRNLEQKPDAWWWNPAHRSFAEVLDRIVPGGGRIAVPGGQEVFDLLLDDAGFDVFHLSRARGISLPGGRPVFGGTSRGVVAESILSGRGMRAGSVVTIDPRVPVELTLWRRAD
ncbi:hypothetical protein [Prosthecomicrobium sp. N25]|uniref:hypothetical protein n=1 Tax=Prosthecomicrobium sp. N25 TaxID=3129254 RepID=UPI00307814E9